MRPYSVLVAVVLAVVVLVPMAFGQRDFRPVPVPRFYGGDVIGYGPFAPFLTTPQISLEQYSPNPVGASNATTGLLAGATNSTMSQIQGSTDSTYSVAVYYQGGAAMVTSQALIWPETIGRDGRVHDGAQNQMRPAMYGPQFGEPAGERVREEGPIGVRPREAGSREHHVEKEQTARVEPPVDWIYITGPVANQSSQSSEATGVGKAGRVYGNDDVTRQNDKNGDVKYDGKTEKL